MAFVGTLRMETDEEATERLAQSPLGSTNHFLSTLPVRNRYPERGQLVSLSSDVVVALVEHRGRGDFRCTVVASGNASYPVGGHDIVVSHDELQRGIPVTVDVEYDLVRRRLDYLSEENERLWNARGWES